MGRRPMGHIGITRSYQPDQLPIWTCRVDFAGFTQQRCLRQRHGAHRAPARAARNGCAASKTRLTTCQAQTAVGFESPCGQLDRRTAQPNRRRRGHCSSMAGLLSRPGPAWHRCLRDCSGEFIRACLAGEASVHLSARVVPLILRGVYPEDCCALWQAWRVLPLAGLVVCPSRP